jgi:hypothetical protein
MDTTLLLASYVRHFLIAFGTISEQELLANFPHPRTLAAMQKLIEYGFAVRTDDRSRTTFSITEAGKQAMVRCIE